MTAIEVQHSRISYDEVLTRHTAHAAADRLDGTVWIVDAPKVGVVDGVAWRTDGNPGLVLTTPWVLDILKACQDTPEPHRSTVGFLVPNAVGGSYGLRFVDSIEWGHTADGARSATVRKWTDRVGQATIREWSKGPGRVLDPRMEHPRRILDAAATRRVKDWIYNPYKVA